MRRLPLPISLIAALLLAAPHVQAQTPGARAPNSAADSAADSTVAQRFRLAMNYQQAGQLDRAIALFEDLHAAQPESRVFTERLKAAYAEAKRYDEALALIDEQIAGAEGPQPALGAERARLLHVAGRAEAARAAWQEAIREAPQQRSTYQTVYQAQVEARLFEQAIATMQQGREALEAPDAFRMELAYLYSLTGQHEAAMGEYLPLLREMPERLSFVQQRLGAFMDREAARRQSIAAAARAVQEAPEHVILRKLMAWLYLEDEQYTDALEAYRVIDQQADDQGRALLGFARLAAEAGAYETAAAAYRHVLDRHAEAPHVPEARHGLGRTYEEWAAQTGEGASGDAEAEATRYRAALDAYRTYLDRHPDGAAYPDVLRRVGRLQQDVLFDLDAARGTLEEVGRRYAHTRAADEAQYDLGRLALMQDRLGPARAAFRRLAERLGSGALADRARYQLALIHFYDESFNEARAVLDTLSTDPSADVLNDALQLRLVLGEGLRGDSAHAALGAYARARLQHRQRHYDDALAALDRLLAVHGRHPLADDARFLRARTLRVLDRADEARTAFAEIPMMHPESPLADRSLLAAAALHVQAGNARGAAAAYNRLLETYPGSLFAAEARQRLRALPQDGDGQ